MLSQFLPVQEIQVLFYLVPVIIAVQLAVYFFYQYRKLRDVNLKLNRILLSFGTFTLLLIFGALQINISRVLIEDPLLKEIIVRGGWCCALSSPFGFLYFINIKEFSELMNLKILKIFMILSLTPVVVVLVIPSTRNPIFYGSLFFTVLSAYYILSFQIKVIRRSIGLIRTKFIQFFLGELISLSSLGIAVPVGLGVFPSGLPGIGLNEIIYFGGVLILFTGFIILFFSGYEFPPFYEFEYRENLSKLFIIDQKDNTGLFHCNMAELVAQVTPKKKKKSVSEAPRGDSDKIFSGGIVGIESVITAITGKTEKIDKIKREDAFILLEYSTIAPSITYVLVVKKDLSSLRHLLQSIKRMFELYYKDFLLNLDKFSEMKAQGRLFEDFHTVIQNMLKR
ncbi:MAG: hypothetical protein LUQ65_06455 [Candidatus Helarchaeota archaeon]|nr:hypothetical protein [Candidatus Helarchaeota archaeon]